MRTDRDDAEAHGDGVLDGEVTETAAGAGEDDPIADVRLGVFDRAVDCDAL